MFWVIFGLSKRCMAVSMMQITKKSLDKIIEEALMYVFEEN
jgi:hypothetical protein